MKNSIRLFGCAVVVAASSLLACGSTPQTSQTMLTSGNVAGQGTVTARTASNGNTRFEVSVKNLAPAQRVASDANMYIVWIQPPNGAYQNAGMLSLDTSLNGDLKGTTVYRSFKVIVTPESTVQALAPSHHPVFMTDVRRE
jgi:hypothetical protein